MAETTSSIQSIQDLGSASETKKASNEFVVVTKTDNLAHNYFHYCELYWDVGDCLSQAIIRFSKSNHTNTNYWLKYEGDIWLYMGHDIHKESENNEEYYDLDVGESPFFVGEVYDVQEYAYEFEVKIRNIGFRFKQNIPDEFRQQYINGQNVRDAFQAICEFLGVQHICPPANVQINANASPDGTEKDVDQIQKKEAAISQDIAKKAASELNNENDNTSPTEESATDTSATDAMVSTPQQGYAQVSFDANGAITYNNSVIEISPDTSQTLISMTDDVFNAYIEDDTNVIQDVKDFLNHKIFEEIHPFYLDYNAITIAPSSTSTSSMSSSGDITGTASDSDEATITQEETMSISSIVQKYYPASTAKSQWVNRLTQCDNTWNAVALIVNKMGGDADKQNTVIKQVLQVKKQSNQKRQQIKQKTTHKAQNILNAAGLPAPNVSDQLWGKALGKTLFNK